MPSVTWLMLILRLAWDSLQRPRLSPSRSPTLDRPWQSVAALCVGRIVIELVDLWDLTRWAVEKGLAEAERRKLLLAGMPDTVLSSLPLKERPREQMMSDLITLRRVAGGLAIWLTNAAGLADSESDDRFAQLRRSIEAWAVPPDTANTSHRPREGDAWECDAWEGDAWEGIWEDGDHTCERCSADSPEGASMTATEAGVPFVVVLRFGPLELQMNVVLHLR